MAASSPQAEMTVIDALRHASQMQLFGLAAFFGAMVFVPGLIANRLLGDVGFGLFANGLLWAVSMFGGIFIRYLVFGEV